MAQPVVAVTLGDPAGVGPEIILKAISDAAIQRACRPIVIGDFGVLRRTRIKGPGARLHPTPWEPGQSLPGTSLAFPVVSITRLSTKESATGKPTKACGDAAYRYITTAVKLIRTGHADAMATAPITKRALHLAGYRYPGHTELLAELTATRECRMMMVGERLKVVLVTVHCPLTQVGKALSRKQVQVTLELTDQALRQSFAISRPRLAVTGLNPHAGEEGIFGHEEKTIIVPAIRAARQRGIRADGPFAADGLFHQAAAGAYDAVVCMYHDQGLIPFKLLHFFDGASLTLGLPIIRTSVDHGTAYDIAGKDKADGSSMKAAILLASGLAQRQKGSVR